jgi:hypothetical protein
MNAFLKKIKNIGAPVICCIIILITGHFSNAQVSTSDAYNRHIHDSLSSQRDVIDLLKKAFSMKRDTVDSAVVKPGKLLLAIVPAIGYAPQTGPTALVAANLSFYVGHPKNTKLSTVVLSQNYSLRNQITIPIVTNIWTPGNKLNLLGDWRYYKYPTFTYGLGDKTTLANADLINYNYIRIHQQALKKIAKHFYLGLGYGLDYHFSILQKGDSTISNFSQYNKGATTTVSSGALLNILHDSRDNINNPNEGTYISLRYHPCFKFLGSDNNWQSIIGDFRKYIKLTPKGNHVLALWSLNWFTFGGKVPYFDLPSTGWDTYSNSGRGYVQGRFRGANMLYLEAEYRFNITKNGLFGGVVFTNAQCLSDWPDNTFKTIYPAAGTGIRIKVNKYSKVNFDIDYAVGAGGSQGLYFNLSELF